MDKEKHQQPVEFLKMGPIEQLDIRKEPPFPTWGQMGEGRKPVLWHRIDHYWVYIYGAMGGGYDAITNAVAKCGQQVRLDRSPLGAALTYDEPDGERCPICEREEAPQP